jgi:hypothetical protein
MTNRLLAAATAISLFMAAGPALAQEMNAAPEAMEPAPMAPAPMTDVSDELLETFIVAFIQVNEIGMGYEAQIEAAASDEDRMAVQFEAQEAMTQAVENLDGITVDEYNSILMAAQTDPEMAARLQSEIDASLAE